MEHIEFDPKKHLGPTDRKRLEEHAKSAGMSPADYIETVLKRALFTGPVQPKFENLKAKEEAA